MTHLTQEMRDANTHAHLKAIAEGQQKRNAELQKARLERYPWIAKAIANAKKEGII